MQVNDIKTVKDIVACINTSNPGIFVRISLPNSRGMSPFMLDLLSRAIVVGR